MRLQPEQEPDRRSPKRGISLVVIASSLGGLGVLRELLSVLPADFPAPLLLVQHTTSSQLVRLLERFTRLSVVQAQNGESLSGSTLYVAPYGRHLTFDAEQRCVLSEGAAVNFVRPAADVLFTSAAERFGAATLGVVLSGRLRDGAAGASAIRRAGGLVIAQDPATCVASGMPSAAIGLDGVDLVLPPQAIAPALVAFATVPRSTVALPDGRRRGQEPCRWRVDDAANATTRSGPSRRHEPTQPDAYATGRVGINV